MLTIFHRLFGVVASAKLIVQATQAGIVVYVDDPNTDSLRCLGSTKDCEATAFWADLVQKGSEANPHSRFEDRFAVNP